MNTQLLKKLYSIHSPSGKEQNMIRFLRSYIGTLPGNISVSQDRYGNLYVIKGTGENYPCLVSHIDQVAHCHHSKDFKAIETKDIIFGYSPGKRRFENPGADDKNGIFICLECLKKYDTIKIAFFREEETGCAGSSNADMPFFNDVRFVIQPDRKGNSDLITSIGFSELCSDEFIKAVKPEEWGYKENNGLLTDVTVLKGNGMGVSCVNLSCGYYNAHSGHEITVKKDLMKGLLFVEHIIEDCTAVYPYTGIFNDRYECEDEIHDILRQDPALTPEDLQYMYATNFPHLKPEDYERICQDYRTLWAGNEQDREHP